MNLKMWRKLRRIPSLSGLNSRCQQVRPTNNLTIRQKRFFRRNRFQFSGELRRNISRRPLYQLGTFLKYKVNNLSSLICLDNSNNIKFQQLLIQENHIFDFLELKASYSQMRGRIQNSLWFYQNSAAVPGAIRVRRARQLHLRYRKSSQVLKLWLNRISEILLYTLFVQTLNVNQRKGYFNFIQILESTMPLVLMKLGFIAIDKINLNLKLVNPGSARNFVQYQKIYRNGKNVNKVWSLLTPGDYLSIRNF